MTQDNLPGQDIARILLDRYRAVSGEHVPFDKRFRTIVVVGAGASKAACGLPLGKELAEAVEAAVLTAGTPTRLIETELDRLEIVNRLGRDEFETRLLALSRFDPETVFSVLRDRCDVRHYPSFTYELIAHLLKHGFLDAVINFNFDEILDQAIDDELGPEQYARIVRDGEWSRALRPSEDNDPWWFDRPLYIKPHGTVSEAASLRFTRDAYFALPPDMARLLRVFSSGAPSSEFANGPKEHNALPQRPLCLLILGHALESFEFNKMLEKSPPGSRLFLAAFGDTKSPASRPEWPAHLREIAKGREIRIKDERGALDNMMRKLWSDIDSRTKRLYRKLPVRGVARHELIAYLFHPTRPGLHFRRVFSEQTSEHKKAIETYFEDRFLVEVTLAIAKAKGFIDLRDLHRGRAGRYYEMLRDVKNRSGRHPIPYYLGKLGMERHDASSDSYWHKNMKVPRQKPGDPVATAPEGDMKQRLTLSPKLFHEKTSLELTEVSREILSHNRKMRLNGTGSQLLLETLNSMFDGDEVEITPPHSDNFMFKFEAPRLVHTVAALKRETDRLLRGAWQLLLCVAESGEWLLHQEIRKVAASRRGAVGLIVADAVYGEQLNKVPRILVQRLPWHLHNRHMTIRLKHNRKTGFLPDLAIYFERRYRSAEISPVLLSEPEDLDRIMDDFTLYWLKAERYQTGKSETIELTRAQLEKERRRLLNDFSRLL